MKYSVEVDSENQTVKVNVSGMLNQERRLNILMAVLNQLSMTGYSRVIFDVRDSQIEESEPLSGALDLISFMKAVGFNENVKMAFVYTDAELHRKYFENASNLGGLNVRYFKCESEAAVWLRTHPGAVY